MECILNDPPEMVHRSTVVENELDVLKHEMYHIKHWDNIVTKGKDYDTIEQELEMDLYKHIKSKCKMRNFIYLKQ